MTEQGVEPALAPVPGSLAEPEGVPAEEQVKALWRRARRAASSVASAAAATTGAALSAAADPGNQAQAASGLASAASGMARGASELAGSTRESMDIGRKAASHAVNKIDPDLLADVISIATNKQEQVNERLLARKSPYRIASLSVGVTFPPSVSFSISRIGDIKSEDDSLTQSDLLEAADIPSSPDAPADPLVNDSTPDMAASIRHQATS